MSEEFMENGIPQGEEVSEPAPVSNEKDTQVEETLTQKDDSGASKVDEVVDLSELAAKDGEFGKANVRQAQPFTVRMKVTQGAIVVTVKRVENDSTQTFFIPVRW